MKLRRANYDPTCRLGGGKTLSSPTPAAPRSLKKDWGPAIEEIKNLPKPRLKLQSKPWLEKERVDFPLLAGAESALGAREKIRNPRMGGECLGELP